MPQMFRSPHGGTDHRVLRGDFSSIVVNSIVSIGLISAFIQISLTILLFAKHGAIFQDDQNLYSFAFLSDALRTNVVLANAWSLSFIPSLTLIFCVLSSYFWKTAKYKLLAFTFVSNVSTHLGLLLIIFFDNDTESVKHLWGVVAAVNGFIFMHLLVIHTDWETLRQTWHPSKRFDSVILVLTIASVGLFAVTFLVLRDSNKHQNSLLTMSVLSEWILLVILMLLQLKLPARAVRIALDVAESNTSAVKAV
jgi:hypothetical protein